MAGDTGGGLVQCFVLCKRRNDDVVTVRFRRGAFVGQPAEHRFYIGRVEFVQLLDVLHDLGHLRRVDRYFFVRYLQVRQLGYSSYVHGLESKKLKVKKLDCEARCRIFKFNTGLKKESRT